MRMLGQITISFIIVLNCGLSLAKANLTEPKLDRGKIDLGVDVIKALKA